MYIRDTLFSFLSQLHILYLLSHTPEYLNAHMFSSTHSLFGSYTQHIHRHKKTQQHLSAARVLTESKQHCLYQLMCIRAMGTPFIPIISDYHHRVLFLLLIFICACKPKDLYQTHSTYSLRYEHSHCMPSLIIIY